MVRIWMTKPIAMLGCLRAECHAFNQNLPVEPVNLRMPKADFLEDGRGNGHRN